ncbi:MAG: EscU/YscU/HrcU family type III secretion system export apparatus switch protein [Verrucomicrobiia bacterium]|jgi:flagellar biosynthetic protein FlhB
MSDFAGEKTEQPTPRRLEEAARRGQFARSPEVQTVFVLGGGLLLLTMMGREMFQNLTTAMTGVFGHIHDIQLSQNNLQVLFIKGTVVFFACVAPVAIGTIAFGLLAGGIQSKFQTSPEALEAKWERINPFLGFQRIFSLRGAVAGGVAFLKLIILSMIVIFAINSIVTDEFFHTAVDMERIADFMAKSALQVGWRVVGALAVIAAIDYAYQYWQTHKDLMMSREELKEEIKNTEGDPFVKAAQRRRRYAIAFRKMLEDVKKADVVVTNPTHLAVALRYDRQTMKAPKVVAKGSRIKAQRIKEIAVQNQVPVIENKPLARMLFKYGKVGAEIPVQLYQAVAEILAYVYRLNRYRYFAEQNQTQT